MSALDAILRTIEAQPGYDPERFDPEGLIASLDPQVVRAIFARVEAEEERARFNRFNDLFPDEDHVVNGVTIHSRHRYPRHLEFFAAGATHRERCFMAANRVGKTIAGGFEMSCHLTGLYPEWWPGKRFRRPVRAWAAGDTNETTRDIIQLELLGEVTYRGTRKVVDGAGLIPRDKLLEPIWKQGVQNLVDTIAVRHVSGGYSLLGLKSYDQGRRAFQGTAKHIIWLDEECPEDVADECRVRLATTRGLMMLTYTPLSGLTPLVLSFLPAEMRPEG